MSGSLVRRLSLLSITRPSVSNTWLHTSAVAEAARKGTREKARKKKVKVELKKVGFIPHNERDKARLKLLKGSKRSVDDKIEEPLDEVYFTKYYKAASYPIAEAIKFHREMNHPTILNRTNAEVSVVIELNMVAEKKTRFMDSFHRIVDLPHPFGTYDDRTVLAFCKTPEQIEEAIQAGADLAGGAELVHKVQSGELAIHEFRFVVAHSSMMAELVPIRGLLKRKFPMAKSGTLGPDMKPLITRFKQGLQYRCEKDDDEHDLGLITTPIGSLEMDSAQLEENFAALIRDVEEARPKRKGDFITWVSCLSAPSTERVKVEYAHYITPPAVSS